VARWVALPSPLLSFPDLYRQHARRPGSPNPVCISPIYLCKLLRSDPRGYVYVSPMGISRGVSTGNDSTPFAQTLSGHTGGSGVRGQGSGVRGQGYGVPHTGLRSKFF